MKTRLLLAARAIGRALLLVVSIALASGCFSERAPVEPTAPEPLGIAGPCRPGNGVECWVDSLGRSYARKDGVECVLARLLINQELVASWWAIPNQAGGASLNPCPFDPTGLR